MNRLISSVSWFFACLGVALLMVTPLVVPDEVFADTGSCVCDGSCAVGCIQQCSSDPACVAECKESWSFSCCHEKYGDDPDSLAGCCENVCGSDNDCLAACSSNAVKTFCAECSRGGDTSGCIKASPPSCPNISCDGTGCTGCSCSPSVNKKKCNCYQFIT